MTTRSRQSLVMEQAYTEFRRAYADAWHEMQRAKCVLGRYRDLHRPEEHEPTTASLKRCTKLLDAFTRDLQGVTYPHRLMKTD